MDKLKDALHIHPEVKQALAEGRPVVALESTIISHGLPQPQNQVTAQAIEAVVQANGAVPATIAVVRGKIRIGLTPDELTLIAGRDGVWKLSLRDLPYALTKGLHGGTTVSATMRLAAMAGIKVFATGGIGGVHRGGERSFDISNDLDELAQTGVCVVCAGAKSILDLGLTLEYLETKGVPVIGYGSDDFPAFYCRESAFKAPCRLDKPEDIAKLLRVKWQLGLKGGAVVAVPIPQEYAMPRATIDAHIQRALAEAESQGITGKEVTPFLLRRLVELTDGATLLANVALVKNNARHASLIAGALAR